MSSGTGPAAGDPTLRRRIEPQEFEDFFNPGELRKEACLLYEISWGRKHNIWRHTGRNTDKHVEINFIENITSGRFVRPSTRCSITWFLSWSPCGECSKAITEFLSQHPNVTLFIYVARLYYHMDPGNRQGLRDLVCRGVTVQIMTEQEYCYCWKYFVNYPPSNEVYWPRYPNMSTRLYILELLCIILGCYKSSGACRGCPGAGDRGACAPPGGFWELNSMNGWYKGSGTSTLFEDSEKKPT